jgi:radical S-adenosyl methionine domain-containing protein 2
MRGIKLLKEAGMRKINFAGGEPFLYTRFLGRLVDYCKEIGVESVSIVSNGSKVKESFLQRHGRNIDILAIFCDSFDEETNLHIGRGTGNNIQQLHGVKTWCDQYGVRFKLNTVVCHLNWDEDMNQHVSQLAPSRWKCFQVLIVQGENDSSERLRDATKFAISSEKFDHFIDKHKSHKSLIPEPNRLMAKSYLILDEYMRFLDRTGRLPSKPILKVGVQEALASVFWDVGSFKERGGVYDWRAETQSCIEQRATQSLEW